MKSKEARHYTASTDAQNLRRDRKKRKLIQVLRSSTTFVSATLKLQVLHCAPDDVHDIIALTFKHECVSWQPQSAEQNPTKPKAGGTCWSRSRISWQGSWRRKMWVYRFPTWRDTWRTRPHHAEGCFFRREAWVLSIPFPFVLSNKEKTGPFYP